MLLEPQPGQKNAQSESLGRSWEPLGSQSQKNIQNEHLGCSWQLEPSNAQNEPLGYFWGPVGSQNPKMLKVKLWGDTESEPLGCSWETFGSQDLEMLKVSHCGVPGNPSTAMRKVNLWDATGSLFLANSAGPKNFPLTATGGPKGRSTIYKYSWGDRNSKMTLFGCPRTGKCESMTLFSSYSLPVCAGPLRSPS